jgi:hypothetical protein
MDANPLTRRARALEDAFIREAETRRRRRPRAEAEPGALAERLGVAPEDVPPAVAEAEVNAELAPAFELLPLVEVAWADGSVDAEERWRVLRGCVRLGLELGTPAHARIERWLRERPAPALFEAWHRIAALRPVPTAESPAPERLHEAAAAVAEASGGILGFRPVSRTEAAVLARLDERRDEAA